MMNINSISLSTEQYELCRKLRNMRFSGMADALQEVFMDPNADLLPFVNKLTRIIDAEWDLRYTKKLNRYIKKATLKYPSADLDETIYDPERMIDSDIVEELSKCDWIKQGRNLIITGKTSSGKSYLANALCICALRRFHSVRYVKASQLIGNLARAEKNDTLHELINEMSSYELLAIDDFGLMELDINRCRNLFEVLDSRDPYKSTLVISQIPVSSWYDIFKEHTYAEACLTRLLNESYRLEMNGKNMRNIDPLNS